MSFWRCCGDQLYESLIVKDLQFVGVFQPTSLAGGIHHRIGDSCDLPEDWFRKRLVHGSRRLSPDDVPRVILCSMEIITRQVGELHPNERSAAELLLGHRLRGNEQLILHVMPRDAPTSQVNGLWSSQTLPDWCNVYEGLSDAEIDEIEKSITRCNLTRSFE